MDSGNYSDNTQCIPRPLTPEKVRHDIRGAFVRLEYLERKETKGESLHKGYKIWPAKRKLNFEDDYIGATSSTREELTQFITAVNSFHPALKQTWETSDISMTFLDIKISI